MARYRLTEPHHLNDVYYEAGAEIEWDGPPSKGMVPLDPPPEPSEAPAPRRKPAKSRRKK